MHIKSVWYIKNVDVTPLYFFFLGDNPDYDKYKHFFSASQLEAIHVALDEEIRPISISML